MLQQILQFRLYHTGGNKVLEITDNLNNSQTTIIDSPRIKVEDKNELKRILQAIEAFQQSTEEQFTEEAERTRQEMENHAW